MSATSWSGDTRLREYGTESAFIEDDRARVLVEDMVDNERAIPDKYQVRLVIENECS